MEISLQNFFEEKIEKKVDSKEDLVHITFKKSAAEGFAKRGPERLEYNLRSAKFIQEKWEGKHIPLRDKQKLSLIIKLIENKLKSHKPVLLYIDPRSKPVYKKLPKKFKRGLDDFDFFKSLVEKHISEDTDLTKALNEAKKESLGDKDITAGIWELKIDATIPRKDILKIDENI